jgi:hypothetical protein
MKKFQKVGLILLIAVVLFFLTIWSCFTIGEKFFFDKLFYKKSALHGYLHLTVDAGTELPRKLTWIEQKILANRLADVNWLVSQASTDSDTSNSSVEIKKNKPFTIIVIGDSNTYAMGVRTSERFSNVLEKKLTKIRPTKVITLAEQGNSIFDDYVLFMLAKKYYQPDLAIVGMVENDLLPNGDRYPQAEKFRIQVEEGCPQAYFSPEDLDFNDWEEILKIYVTSFSPEYKNLCVLKHISQKFSTEKNILFFPFNNFKGDFICLKDEDAATCNQKLVIMEYKQALQATGNTVIDYKKNDIFEPISKAEGHPSKHSHALYAQLLFEYIMMHTDFKNFQK